MRNEKISLIGVSKSFTSRGKSLSALENVSMKIMEGELACVVGPSGCGKSTLLSIIAGLEKPDSGTVLVDGKPVSGTGNDRTLIFQDGALFPWLTVSGNIEFGLKMAGVEKAVRKEKVSSLLRMMHLTRFAHSGIHELSGGMKQRVAIARALAMDPEILLMDEPFAALDAQTRDALHEELIRIWKETGKTIVFVTHNVSEAVRLGDRVFVFSYRPGAIKKEFKVECKRPRLREDPRLGGLVHSILSELEEEREKAVLEELGYANP